MGKNQQISDEMKNSRKKNIKEHLFEQNKKKKYHLKINDSVLGAVQEAQPFEEAADRSLGSQNYFGIVKDQIINDVFGFPIKDPDISNPTRARNERPLDTIRGFEYSITGNPHILTQLETTLYGFSPRPEYNFRNIVETHTFNREVQKDQTPVQEWQEVEETPSPPKWQSVTQKYKIWRRAKNSE